MHTVAKAAKASWFENRQPDCSALLTQKLVNQAGKHLCSKSLFSLNKLWRDSHWHMLPYGVFSKKRNISLPVAFFHNNVCLKKTTYNLIDHLNVWLGHDLQIDKETLKNWEEFLK